jgi:hypothetical protein
MGGGIISVICDTHKCSDISLGNINIHYER